MDMDLPHLALSNFKDPKVFKGLATGATNRIGPKCEKWFAHQVILTGQRLARIAAASWDSLTADFPNLSRVCSSFSKLQSKLPVPSHCSECFRAALLQTRANTLLARQPLGKAPLTSVSSDRHEFRSRCKEPDCGMMYLRSSGAPESQRSLSECKQVALDECDWLFEHRSTNSSHAERQILRNALVAHYACSAK